MSCFLLEFRFDFGITMDINITNFKPEYSQKILSLINSQDSNFTQDNVISETLLTQMISIPDSNPEKDCYVISNKEDIIGFVQLIHESPISRTVLKFWISDNIEKNRIFTMIIKKIELKFRSLDSKFFHIQIPENSYESILVKNNWNRIKTYITLKLPLSSSPIFKIDPQLKITNLKFESDETDLTNLQNICFQNNWGFSPNSVNQISYRIRMENCSPQGIVFIESENKKIAYNWTLLNENNKTGLISMIGVHPEFQGKGIGKQILLAGLKSLYNRGAKIVSLEVDSENENAMNLYKKIGFAEDQKNIWFEFI